MGDDRHLQEAQADLRTTELVRESQDTRARVIDALDAVQRELDRAKREAQEMYLPKDSPRRRRWLW